MKKICIRLSLLLLLLVVMVQCKDDFKHVDPMIYGITENIQDAIATFTQSNNFGIALIGLREQRIKLFGMLAFIEKDGYSGDDYGLQDKEAALQHVNQLIGVVTMKLDSVWDVNIKNAFNAVDENSAGIQNFGKNTYNQTVITVANAYAWLKVERKDATQGEWIALDFANLQTTVGVLAGLSALNNEEVLQFVNNIKARFAQMQQQYADLASEVSTSPYFTKAQKEMYAGLEGTLAEMAVTIEDELSLGTVDELDAIDRDLGALVYFVNNNYTSPAQQPLVYGEISRITELRWLSERATADDWSKNWKLMADIDASETRRWNGTFGYIPIVEFSGKFDGQYHIISGLYMNDYLDAHTGFIGRLVDGEISNLGLVNVNIITRQPQGGAFVGYVIRGKLTNCFSHGVVALSGQSGGFIGRADNSTLTNCYTFAYTPFRQAGNHGPFAGLLTVTNLANCYSTGLNDGIGSNSHAFVGNITGADVKAVGTFYDSTIAVKPQASNAPYFNALVTPLPTASWGNLGNFPTYSPNDWEIKTIHELDANPRPYLKAFNYNALKDFIVPGK